MKIKKALASISADVIRLASDLISWQSMQISRLLRTGPALELRRPTWPRKQEGIVLFGFDDPVTGKENSRRKEQ